MPVMRTWELADKSIRRKRKCARCKDHFFTTEVIDNSRYNRGRHVEIGKDIFWDGKTWVGLEPALVNLNKLMASLQQMQRGPVTGDSISGQSVDKRRKPS